MVDVSQTVLPASTGWYKSAWNGTTFVAVSNTSNIAATSTDGTNWVQRVLPIASAASDIASDGVQFVLVRSSGSTAYTSPDGITWTPRTLPSAGDWVGVAWNGTVFCAITTGTAGATSPDGITWTPRTLPASANSKQAIDRATFGFAVFAFDTAAVYTSADGATWNTVVRPQRDRYSLATDGTINCVPVLNSNIVETSFDGVSWSDVTLPSSTFWYEAAWNGTEFFIIGNFVADAASSPDGLVWTPVTLPAALNWQALTAGGGVFVAAGMNTSVGLLGATTPPVVSAFWTNRIRTQEVI